MIKERKKYEIIVKTTNERLTIVYAGKWFGKDLFEDLTNGRSRNININDIKIIKEF